ncbi:MAG: hypothetical protein QF376_03185, partial [Anaerolineales bacterium]|nr:hypothetical protein [Anaerolineales bacterium]
MQGWFPHSLRIVITVALPFVLVLSNVRLVLMPWFPTFEYNRPRFPADAYGFSTDMRKFHARRAVEYLLNAASIDYLAEERFEDGAPLYNGRELRHMQDVKMVTGRVLWVWRGALLFALAAGVALDLTTLDPTDGQPWNFDLKVKREQARALVAEQEPIMVVGSTVC